MDFLSDFKKSILTIVAVLFFFAGVAFAADEYVPGEILVKYRKKENQRSKMAISLVRGAKVLYRYKNIPVEKWQVDDVEAAVKELSGNSDIEYAEPNYLRYPRYTPSDNYFSMQWYLNNNGGNLNEDYGVEGLAGADMDLVRAWDIELGNSAVRVAVVDDGVQLNHPDLSENIVAGWDFDGNDSSPYPGSSYDSHGTMVAGVLGAVGDNGIGVSGVANDVSIVPLRFDGSISDEVNAFDWAIANGVDIVNFSYGGVSTSNAERDAVQRLEDAGILLVCAAGNYDINNDLIHDYPSGYSNSNIITVAASSIDDEIISWTQFGQISVDLVAPGEYIYTTDLDSGYILVDGTSFSAPAVAGVAALVKSSYPDADYSEIKGRILAGAELNSTVKGYAAIAGRVNAYNALTVLEAPVIVIKSISYSGEDNGIPDAGETVNITLELENIWAEAESVTAEISTDDQYVSIDRAVVSYPNIAEVSSSESIQPFVISLSDQITSNRKILFAVDIAAQDYSITRYFILETGGKTESGNVYNGIIQRNDMDDVHHYYIAVPDEATDLRITTDSQSDIDLFVKKEGFPVFIFYGDYSPGEDTLFSIGNSGDESILVRNPDEAIYHIAVANASSAYNIEYELEVSYSVAGEGQDEGGSGGGGGGGGTVGILMLLFLNGLLVTRKIFIFCSHP